MKETWTAYWKDVRSFNCAAIASKDLYYALLKCLLDRPQKSTQNVLEVGCGSGIRTIALQKELQDQNINIGVTLVDFSPSALCLAKENAETNEVNVDLVEADILSLPFEDETFDIVWNEGVNEHFNGEQRQIIFNEMARVCKSGGQVIVIVPNAFNVPYRIRKKLSELRGTWPYGFEKPFNIIELRRCFQKAGLRPVRMSGIGIFNFINFIIEPLINRARNRDIPQSLNNKNNLSNRKILRVYYRIELMLQKIMWPLSGNIGIGGRKYS